MDYCISSACRRRNELSESGPPGKKLFCKRCSVHGEQCLCAGIKLIAGKGHGGTLLAPRPVDLGPLSENSYMSSINRCQGSPFTFAYTASHLSFCRRVRDRLFTQKAGSRDFPSSSAEGPGRFSCKKEPPGLPAEQKKQSSSENAVSSTAISSGFRRADAPADPETPPPALRCPRGPFAFCSRGDLHPNTPRSCLARHLRGLPHASCIPTLSEQPLCR